MYGHSSAFHKKIVLAESVLRYDLFIRFTPLNRHQSRKTIHEADMNRLGDARRTWLFFGDNPLLKNYFRRNSRLMERLNAHCKVLKS